MDTTSKNTAAAEAKLGAWVPTKDEDGKWVVPTADAEFKLTGTQADVRLGVTSDPICSSAGCTQYKHPSPETHKMNYFVPDFGKDHDIRTSEDNAAAAEKVLGHTFTPKFDEEKDEWVVPTAEAEFRLAGVKEDIHLGKHKKKSKTSDPSCTSAGWCGESLWPKQRAKEDEHAVLRHDTLKGANQEPTEEEFKANKEKAILARPDPHPSTEEPESKEQEADRLAREAANKKAAEEGPDNSDLRKKSS